MSLIAPYGAFLRAYVARRSIRRFLRAYVAYRSIRRTRCGVEILKKKP